MDSGGIATPAIPIHVPKIPVEHEHYEFGHQDELQPTAKVTPMDWLFLWDDAVGGNVEHIAEHGLTPEEVESAFGNVETETTSRSTGRPAIFGRTLNGDVIFVVYDIDHDDDSRSFIYVHTAYFAEE